MERKRRMKQVLAVLFLVLFLVPGYGLSGRMAPVYGKEKKEDNEVHLEKVHTLYWRATLRRNIMSGKKVLAKAGSRVTVIHRHRAGNKKSLIMFGKDKKKMSVPNSWLNYQGDLPTIETEGDYNTATKEAFINKKAKVKKKEKYLVWVSMDKQRVNLFHAEKNRWKLENVFMCSTGNVSSPTPVGWARVDYKRPWLSGLQWFTEVVGGGMHKWPGKFDKKIFGKHVASGGCIRLSEKAAHYIYKKVPVGGRVLVY